MTHFCVPVVVLSIIILIKSDVITKYVECIDVSGDSPSSMDPKSTATCPSTHVLTSCESKPIKIGNYNDEIFGSSIQGNSCVSWTDYNNGWILDGIRAYARCCALTDYGPSFIKTYSSTISGWSDDSKTSISCPQPNEKLIGCTGITTEGYWDGSFVGNGTVNTNTHNTCQSQQGSGGSDASSGSYAIARCYDTTLINDGYELECISVWGEKTTSTSTASCPSTDYFMTSCSGYSLWSSIGQYMIQNNVCTVTHLTSRDWSVANGVCCRLTKPTDNPTVNPTNIPTIQPTYMPSMNTMSPSINPTIEPTLYPSVTPTKNTPQPTENPTIFPTGMPTMNPTLSPTVHPTPTPTIKLIITKPTAPPVTSNMAVVISTTSIINVVVSNISETKSKKSETMNLISILIIVIGILLVCICSIWIALCLKQRKKHKISSNNMNMEYGNSIVVIIPKKIAPNVIEMEEIESKTNIMNDGYDETGTLAMISSIKETDSGDVNGLNNDEFIIDDDHIDIITPGSVENEGKYITNGGSFNMDNNDEVITGSDNDQTDQGTATEGDTDDMDNINNEHMDDDMDVLHEINTQTVQ